MITGTRRSQHTTQASFPGGASATTGNEWSFTGGGRSGAGAAGGKAGDSTSKKRKRQSGGDARTFKEDRSAFRGTGTARLAPPPKGRVRAASGLDYPRPW